MDARPDNPVGAAWTSQPTKQTTPSLNLAQVIMRIREPKTTALVFASGKMVRATKTLSSLFFTPACPPLPSTLPMIIQYFPADYDRKKS
eukprot:SAG22_NODE_15796_length_340_cov_0.854772_1_plen_88_part_10